MAATSRVELDEAALYRELHTREGAVGRVVAGFAGTATKRLKEEMQRRAGGAWWQVTSSISMAGHPVLRVEVKSTRPHVIVPRRAGGVLVFELAGQTIFTRRVDHPGSSAPARLVERVLEEVGHDFPQLAAQAAAGA